MDGRQEATSSSEASSRSPLGRGFGLGRVFGIEVRIDASLLIIFALVVFSLGSGVFRDWHPEWSTLASWSLAVAAALLFFASVLVHELSHALTARWQGLPIRRITLFLFGGLAHMEKEPPTPRAEFLMAIVGPVTSIAIGLASTAAGVALAGDALSTASVFDDAERTVEALGAVGPAATLLLWLGPINLMLGLFNMVPGFPLDGGRVFRSIVWAFTGDVAKATLWASRAGQLFAWALMITGAMNAFGGALVSGLWLILIGWFLSAAARGSYEQLLIQRALERIPVSTVMRTRFESAPAALSVADLVRDYLLATEQRAFPIRAAEGGLVGLVCFEDVRRVPQERWEETSVAEVMTPASGLHTLAPDAPATRALEELTKHDVDQIPVVTGGRIIGLVRRSDILKWLTLQGAGPHGLWGPRTTREDPLS